MPKCLVLIILIHILIDVTSRRKLLYSLLPKDNDFPYHIIPLAVSSASVVLVGPSWKHAVLSWLGALLEYGIISSHNQYLHLCYTAIFNLTFHLNLCGLACKVLHYITLHEDVTQNRALVLMRLKMKPGFYVNVSQLLRLYHLFRPDLVVGKLAHRRVVPSTPRNLKIALLAARTRLQEATETTDHLVKDIIWPDNTKAEKANPYQRKMPFPQPDATLYTTKLEEKKEKVIFVTQYRRFSELVHGIEEFQSWQWPNNPATHLTKPIIIPLFRPHHRHIFVGLTNWLEFALRTEVIEGIGNPSAERCEKLLQAALDLVQDTGTVIPIINHFMTELMVTWSEKTHFEKVLALLGAVSFSSPEFISETLLKLVARLLYEAPLVTWCKVINAVTNTTCSWAIVAQQETIVGEKYHEWPDQARYEGSIVGLWFLTHRLEKFFLAALLKYDCHPLVLHHILDYYVKVNMYTRVLELPVVFFPPAIFTLVILTKGDLMTTHRLGRLMSSMQAAMYRVKNMETAGPESAIREECISLAENINQAVIFYMSGVYTSKAFTPKWEKVLDQFYPFHNFRDVLKSNHVRSYAGVTQSLAYLPFFAKYLIDSDDVWSSKERAEVREKVLGELKEAGLTGIEECVVMYTKQ
ncbi:centromere protein I-like isoform X2 [Homarus americanus]|uniref:centromere protein I-like isoform X2 n=1 Tax=Homarus americanus TaxID=6706 RepID=UPI001C48BF23|nr:centromere protein I-like isoform X2 [Homarus americanus]